MQITVSRRVVITSGEDRGRKTIYLGRGERQRSVETDETDTVTARYSHRPEQFGELISQQRAGATSYYHYDGNHSTCNLTDEDETVTDTVFYTAYGEEGLTFGINNQSVWVQGGGWLLHE